MIASTNLNCFVQKILEAFKIIHIGLGFKSSIVGHVQKICSFMQNFIKTALNLDQNFGHQVNMKNQYRWMDGRTDSGKDFEKREILVVMEF